MTRPFAILVALVLAAPGRAADTDLLFPDGDTVARLRVAVTDGKGPEAAWVAFLDKLFAYFDRDGSGTLSEAEAKRWCEVQTATVYP